VSIMGSVLLLLWAVTHLLSMRVVFRDSALIYIVLCVSASCAACRACVRVPRVWLLSASVEWQCAPCDDSAACGCGRPGP